jgi:hypothetical protein
MNLFPNADYFDSDYKKLVQDVYAHDEAGFQILNAGHPKASSNPDHYLPTTAEVLMHIQYVEPRTKK